jgi:hypothetical protein
MKQIEELQAQMLNAVTAAVEKASGLEKELQDSKRRNEELESKLAEL